MEVIFMLNLNSLLLFSEHPQRLAEFYEKVFERKPDMSFEGYFGWQIGASFLTVGPHDKVHGKNVAPERILINYETEHVDLEFNRIKQLGATVIAEPYQPGEDPSGWIATFADPDGNYFQLGTPMDMAAMEAMKA